MTFNNLNSGSERIVFLDWLRFIACFMVILVHSIEPFYLGGPDGTYIASLSDAFWVTFINSALRPAVPLFVMASSYLLFPLKTDAPTFFRKRFVRVLIPFLVWTALYACVPFIGNDSPADIVGNFKNLCVNFMMHAGHLWFVYMLIGVYLLMPMLSPWIEKISRNEERAFLILWTVTTLLPFLRPWAQTITGNPDLWGECPWNDFGTFYYVSGFVGYLVLGHYIRTYVKDISWKKTLAYAVPFWLLGYSVASGGFWHIMPRELGFPLSASYQTAVDMETTWNFCTFGVMMQTVAYFLLIRKITASGWIYRHLIYPVSRLSYGIYLMHMFVLVPVFSWITSWGMPTPMEMLLSAVMTYVICMIMARCIAFLPKSNFIIG